MSQNYQNSEVDEEAEVGGTIAMLDQLRALKKLTSDEAVQIWKSGIYQGAPNYEQEAKFAMGKIAGMMKELQVPIRYSKLAEGVRARARERRKGQPRT